MRTYSGNVRKLKIYGQALEFRLTQVGYTSMSFLIFYSINLKFVRHGNDKILDYSSLLLGAFGSIRIKFRGKANQTASLVIHKARSVIKKFQVANF